MPRKELVLTGMILVLFGILLGGYRWANPEMSAGVHQRPAILTVRIPSVQRNRTVSEVLAVLKTPIWERLKPDMDRCGFDDWPKKLAFVVMKADRNMEMWGRNRETEPWSHIRDYPMTATCGKLGPKLREGDLQIPEGVYRIPFLNPNSSYHLSLMVNYPNRFDRQKGREDGRTRLGGEIFIHGNAVTIGCIPIGDGPIEEVFTAVGMCGKENATVIITPVDFRKGLPAPDIPHISWESELYDILKQKLEAFPLKENNRIASTHRAH